MFCVICPIDVSMVCVMRAIDTGYFGTKIIKYIFLFNPNLIEINELVQVILT